MNGNIVAAVAVLLPIVASGLLLALPGVTWTAIVTVRLPLGRRNPAVLFGTISGLLSLCTRLGPLVVCRVFDVTRSYDIALWAYVPLSVLAAALFLSLSRYANSSEDAMIPDATIA